MTGKPQRVLLRGGSVYTQASPFATALLTVGGEVAWVGRDEATLAFAETADLVVDLAGSLVTPGFVDAHSHLGQTGFALQSLDLASARCVDDALDALAAFARRHTGSVLFAYGWDESLWPEGRAFTIDELDAAVGHTVAYVARVDSHSAVISSALLARDRSIADRDGWLGDGLVVRDAHHGARTVTHVMWTAADREAALRTALGHAGSLGITSLHELNAPHIAPFSDFTALQAIAAETPGPEVVPYWGALLGGDVDDLAARDVLGFAGDLCVDGAVGSRTACMHDPYADADTRGYLYLDREQVAEHVVFCTVRGLQAGFHVIGDRAMAETVAGLESAAARVGVDAMVAARHRLEHVEMPTPRHLEVMARLGVAASVQPAFDAAWGAAGGLYERRLGHDRAWPMNPFGAMLRAGVILAFGSDSPITPLGPWAGVRAATSHHDEGQWLTVREAFDAHTRGGHQARRNDSGGVLAPGAPASYAVWAVDGQPTVQTPDERRSNDPRVGVPVLPDLDTSLPTCLQTVVAGARIFDAEQLCEARTR
ncbi:MAG: amidohydrolase family protein [Propionibacteriales bacterium]|nr:amidohydrolase family protein [Propionibacteriales bacterium]